MSLVDVLYCLVIGIYCANVPLSSLCFISEAPEVFVSADQHHVSVGESVSVSCNVSGYPEPELHWLNKQKGQTLVRMQEITLFSKLSYANEHVLTNMQCSKSGMSIFALSSVALCQDMTSGRVRVVEGVLEIDDLMPSDGGLYSCMAVSSSGNASRDVAIYSKFVTVTFSGGVKKSHSGILNISNMIYFHFISLQLQQLSLDLFITCQSLGVQPLCSSRSKLSRSVEEHQSRVLFFSGRKIQKKSGVKWWFQFQVCLLSLSIISKRHLHFLLYAKFLLQSDWFEHFCRSPNYYQLEAVHSLHSPPSSLECGGTGSVLRRKRRTHWRNRYVFLSLQITKKKDIFNYEVWFWSSLPLRKSMSVIF